MRIIIRHPITTIAFVRRTCKEALLLLLFLYTQLYTRRYTMTSRRVARSGSQISSPNYTSWYYNYVYMYYMYVCINFYII